MACHGFKMAFTEERSEWDHLLLQTRLSVKIYVSLLRSYGVSDDNRVIPLTHGMSQVISEHLLKLQIGFSSTAHSIP